MSQSLSLGEAREVPRGGARRSFRMVLKPSISGSVGRR